jgi:hypothetical protein
VPLFGSLSASSHAKSEPVSPLPEQTVSGSNLPQPPSERSETIGSDSVEVYPPPPPSENAGRDARYLFYFHLISGKQYQINRIFTLASMSSIASCRFVSAFALYNKLLALTGM